MDPKLLAETPKLPLEVVGLILLKLDQSSNDGQLLDQLKKCRLISPRWYKAVQDVFRDEFYEKFASHFNGHSQSFSTSRTFGFNIFGFHRLNFATLRISQSEYYLMKTWLRRLVSDNLQNLELHNNLLNWKELIQVLQHFPNIVNFKFVQSTDNLEIVENVYHKFKMDLGCFQNGLEYYRDRKIENHIKSLDRFEILPKLKYFHVKVVHIQMVNILAEILSFALCPSFERILITIDYIGLTKLCIHHRQTQMKLKLKPIPLYQQSNFVITSFLTSVGKSLKKFEIKVQSYPIKFPEYFLLRPYTQDEETKAENKEIWNIEFRLRFFIARGLKVIFSKPLDMNNLETLKIIIPKYKVWFEEKDPHYMCHFVKNLKNLKKFHISTFSYELENHDEFANFLRNLVYDENNPNRCTSIGHEVGHDEGFGVLQEFSEYLTKIRILLDILVEWRFSDADIPIFENCKEMSIETDSFPEWENFEVPVIIQKFPNLDKISIRWKRNQVLNPKISNEDLQLILSHYTNLKYLHLENSTSEQFTDSGITGLNPEVVQNRIDNPEILRNEIQPGEKTGIAISHLQNLKSLVIKSATEQINLTDITAHFAFENMPKLKNLQLGNTAISTNGFEIIREKCQSRNLTLSN